MPTTVISQSSDIILSQDWESGMGEWYATNDIWEVGQPEMGPAGAFSGQQCAGTVLNDNYPPGAKARLVSPPIAIPAIASNEAIILSFIDCQWWHPEWGENRGDDARIQVSFNGDDWYPITENPYDGSSNSWHLEIVDLSIYSGFVIQLGFYFESDTIQSDLGWYVDDILIEKINKENWQPPGMFKNLSLADPGFPQAILGQASCAIPPPIPDRIHLDHAIHDVGKIWQVISNFGMLGFNCIGLGTYPQRNRMEFPIGSGHSYIYTGSLIFAGRLNQRKLFSIADGWSENSPICANEMFPTAEPWDSVWVVNRGETVDIGDPEDPYLRNFTPIGDQALVCRYNDWNVQHPEAVDPLFLEVIQISHAWSFPPLDEFILFEYYVTADRVPINGLYIGQWIGAELRPSRQLYWGRDDLVYYDEERQMGIVEDLEGNNDDEIPGPIGFMLFPPPPSEYGRDDWRITFNNRTMPDHIDNIQYDITSAGTIDPPSTDGDQDVQIGDRGFFRLAFGPISMEPGDTVHFFIGEVVADGEGNKERALQGLYENADRLIWIKDNGFKTPFPPPRPDFRVTTSNHAVTLNWEIQPGGVNPEAYQDTIRLDMIDQPFEGYRLYKSTEGVGGPWTLLQEYDIAGNEFGANTGLAYEFTDFGLVNNLEYYYSLTAFSKEDTVSNFPSQETSLTANAISVTPGTAAPETVGKVAAVPNPYRGDIGYQDFKPAWERPDNAFGRWTENDRRIQFINLPSPSEIKIYTLAGDLVETIQHNDANRGFADWNLTSSVGQTVSSGIYMFTVKDKRNGNVQVGKFVIVK